jgi:NhaA family Na+:H+ antiporter
MNASTTSARPPASTPPIDRVLRPFQQFMHAESSSGILLLVTTAVALFWANSIWAGSYFALWEQPITIGAPALGLTKTLHHWINDGLMVAFFVFVGLEIKREFLVGELSSAKKAALPLAGAIGGVLLPAGIYLAFNAGGPGQHGWGVPMATDIAFALGVLALAGDRVPTGLKIFLSALAIVDDIAAVLVIALFYTADVNLASLGIGAVVLGLLIGANAAGFRHPLVYTLLGILLWLAFLASGVHATIAGVLLAMTIPARTRIDADEFADRVDDTIREFRAGGLGDGDTVLTNQAHQEAIHQIESLCEEAQAPLLKIEDKLHLGVAFVIMPLFALANAGVALPSDLGAAFKTPVTLGVMAGLVLGKPLGITLAAWLAVRVGLAERPAGVGWIDLHGVAWLGGIGFTMSLFIGALAFREQDLLAGAKIGVLAASTIAGAVGWLILRRRFAPGRSRAEGSA